MTVCQANSPPSLGQPSVGSVSVHARPLILVAASGLGREVLATLRTHGPFHVIGFLDDAPELRGTDVDGVRVFGGVEEVVEHPAAALLVCAGRGAVREAIVGRLATLGVHRERYASVVHPSVEVPGGSTIGSGSVVLAGTVLTTAVALGDHVVAMPNVTLTHDDVVEDFVTLAAGASLGGGVRIGRGAFIGMNAGVHQGVTVGAGATLGMGAALLVDLPAGQTWAGVPARPIDGSAAQPLKLPPRPPLGLS